MAQSVAPTEPAAASVYQLRVVVAEVSPLIWRRLLVSASTTIGELHAVLQAAFGWSGQHLHRFAIHGREYGIGYVGGPGFHDDAHRVALTDLGLRATERFAYHYDFTDDWRLDLRVQNIMAAEVGQSYPRCTGGRRAGPPEGCGGPWAFLEQTQPHRVYEATLRAAEILGQLLDEEFTTLGADREELTGLLPLLGLERFDRRTLNRTLAGLTTTDRSVT